MAATKIDKEALKKNLFWILLGVFVLFWLIAVVVALFSGSDAAAKSYKDAKAAVDGAKSKGVKTPAYQEPWKAHGTMFRQHKDVIWRKAWEQQKGMYDWPDSMRQVVAPPLYPEDPFVRDAAGQKNVIEDQKVRSSFRAWYQEQFTGLDQIVSPAEFNGGFNAVFPAQSWEKGTPPTAEEIWLAQEDFWVRRELLFLIRQAMDSVALFREVTPPAKKDRPGDGLPAPRVFRNANWELTIIAEPAKDGRGLVISDKSTIKNVSVNQRTQLLANPRQPNLGLPFRLIQGTAYSQIRIAGEPVPFGAEVTVGKSLPVSPVNLRNPFLVEQILDWQISPVRRIDLLALARHSHRTQPDGLKINPELKKLDEEKSDTPDPTAAANPAGGMTPPGGSMMPPGGGMQPGGGMMPPGGSGMTMPGGERGAAATADVTTVNKIPRQRYLHVTPQCRHLPVVIRLVVDQANIHDVLSSISNSRLRMQITQVSFHHVRDVTPSPEPSGTTPPDRRGGGREGEATPPVGSPNPPSYGPGMTGPPGGGIAMPMMPGGSMYPGGGGRMLLGGPNDEGMGPRRGGVGGKGTPATPAAQAKDNARLVELSVYAIASLYDRYPPRQKDAAPSGTPPSP